MTFILLHLVLSVLGDGTSEPCTSTPQLSTTAQAYLGWFSPFEVEMLHTMPTNAMHFRQGSYIVLI